MSRGDLGGLRLQKCIVLWQVEPGTSPARAHAQGQPRNSLDLYAKAAWDDGHEEEAHKIWQGGRSIRWLPSRSVQRLLPQTLHACSQWPSTHATWGHKSEGASCPCA